MNYLPSYLEQIDKEGVYSCQICLAILSSPNMIESHWQDVYHNQMLFQMKKKVLKYEQDMLDSGKIQVQSSKRGQKEPNVEKKMEPREENEARLRRKIEKLKSSMRDFKLQK